MPTNIRKRTCLAAKSCCHRPWTIHRRLERLGPVHAHSLADRAHAEIVSSYAARAAHAGVRPYSPGDAGKPLQSCRTSSTILARTASSAKPFIRSLSGSPLRRRAVAMVAPLLRSPRSVVSSSNRYRDLPRSRRSKTATEGRPSCTRTSGNLAFEFESETKQRSRSVRPPNMEQLKVDSQWTRRQCLEPRACLSVRPSRRSLHLSRTAPGRRRNERSARTRHRSG